VITDPDRETRLSAHVPGMRKRRAPGAAGLTWGLPEPDPATRPSPSRWDHGAMTSVRRTQVGIVGAGPAGLMLAVLLRHHGVDSVVLETRSRRHLEQRVRAGVLEHGTVELLHAAGVGERLRSQGLPHRGINLAFAGERHRIDLSDLTGGKEITVYGQQEVVKDLLADHVGAGGHVEFEARATSVSDFDGEHPRVAYEHAGVQHTLACDVVVGCDGSHGVCRAALKPGARTVYERSYPFAWLGVLAQTPPASDELIYAYHDHGFALHSMRSPDVSRLYLQVDAAEDPDAWPDARIWEELEIRLGEPSLRPGPVLEKGVTPMRSLVTEPMQQGRLFIAGDAAHVVPPTGAKGMNLALADVRVLAEALGSWYAAGSTRLVEQYSETCLRRVWRAEHFSSWMTALLHRDPAWDPFEHRLRLSHLRYVTSSRAAAASLAENYVGAVPG
jgi:p-hydroxybenzoate 3-monooxygenase